MITYCHHRQHSSRLSCTQLLTLCTITNYTTSWLDDWLYLTTPINTTATICYQHLGTYLQRYRNTNVNTTIAMTFLTQSTTSKYNYDLHNQVTEWQIIPDRHAALFLSRFDRKTSTTAERSTFSTNVSIPQLPATTEATITTVHYFLSMILLPVLSFC